MWDEATVFSQNTPRGRDASLLTLYWHYAGGVSENGHAVPQLCAVNSGFGRVGSDKGGPAWRSVREEAAQPHDSG
ncbi:hypothetical protein MHYP_G00009210 [Metynnis hypsauchen]